jgi:hypothetical protein
MRQQFCGFLGEADPPEMSRAAENKGRKNKGKFKFLSLGLQIRFFLGTFVFGNLLAKRAGVFAIKGLFQGFAQGGML